MWLANPCERCGYALAEVQCDDCGEYQCCDCSNILNRAIVDAKGKTVLHLCDECADKLSEDGEINCSLRLVVDNTEDKKDV